MDRMHRMMLKSAYVVDNDQLNHDIATELMKFQTSVHEPFLNFERTK